MPSTNGLTSTIPHEWPLRLPLPTLSFALNTPWLRQSGGYTSANGRRNCQLLISSTLKPSPHQWPRPTEVNTHTTITTTQAYATALISAPAPATIPLPASAQAIRHHTHHLGLGQGDRDDPWCIIWETSKGERLDVDPRKISLPYSADPHTVHSANNSTAVHNLRATPPPFGHPLGHPPPLMQFLSLQITTLSQFAICLFNDSIFLSM